MIPESVRRRSVTLLVAALVAVSGAAGVVGIAGAAGFAGSSGTVVVPAGETYDAVEGAVGTLVVHGTVTGDVDVVAGSVVVTETGVVGGNLDAAAGNVDVEGEVGDDVTVTAGSVDVNGVVGGDVAITAGSAVFGPESRVGGDVHAGAGSVSVDGAVNGSVLVIADHLALGPGSRVGGDVRYDVETLDRSPDATVGGAVVADPSVETAIDPAVPAIGGVGAAAAWVASVYGLLANLALGAVLLLAFPGFTAGVVRRIGDDPLRTGGIGLLALVGVPIVLVLLAVTLVGLPLAVVGLFASVAFTWVASVYGQYAVAALVVGRAGLTNRWLALVVGLVGFALLALVPILGALAAFAAFLLGLGALAHGLRDAYRDRRGRGRSRTP